MYVYMNNMFMRVHYGNLLNKSNNLIIEFLIRKQRNWYNQINIIFLFPKKHQMIKT